MFAIAAFQGFSIDRSVPLSPNRFFPEKRSIRYSNHCNIDGNSSEADIRAARAVFTRTAFVVYRALNAPPNQPAAIVRSSRDKWRHGRQEFAAKLTFRLKMVRITFIAFPAPRIESH